MERICLSEGLIPLTRSAQLVKYQYETPQRTEQIKKKMSVIGTIAEAACSAVLETVSVVSCTGETTVCAFT